MEIPGSVDNNTDPRVCVVDGRPLKSILKKPKESSIVPGKDGCVRTDFVDRNQPVEAAVGVAADPNQSGWFEATIEPEGVKGSNKVGSSGGVNKENTQTETKQMKPRVNFRPFVNEERVANHDIVLPKSAIETVSIRYANSLVGFFVGKSIAFPIVQNYVTNTWGQFGLQNVMKSDDGVFLFKFASNVGLEKIPLVAYSEDGFSLIAMQVGKPIMLDAFTSSMCNDSWGRISYARALVEISAGTDLKTEVSMVVPNEDEEGYTSEVISVEYEWKPPHCRDCNVFGHTHDTCPNNVNKPDPNTTIKADHSDGFTEVKRKKNKGRKVDQQPKARNSGGDGVPKPKPNAFRFNKPRPNDYQPKRASQAAQEKEFSFSPQPKIHYFDRDDTDDANMDVGAECGAFSSTDTQNEDLESDEEVDELIFSECDKFDIRLKGRTNITTGSRIQSKITRHLPFREHVDYSWFVLESELD
ncbi:putative reverse transcriptase domain, reverse transcriptase zinc-binding domain protein [Tanacetum coccineum]